MNDRVSFARHVTVTSELTQQATNQAVKKKALGYIKEWAKQFEESGDPNLGLMGELYDQLRGKSELFSSAMNQHSTAHIVDFAFDEPEAAPEDVVSLTVKLATQKYCQRATS